MRTTVVKDNSELDPIWTGSSPAVHTGEMIAVPVAEGRYMAYEVRTRMIFIGPDDEPTQYLSVSAKARQVRLM